MDLYQPSSSHMEGGGDDGGGDDDDDGDNDGDDGIDDEGDDDAHDGIDDDDDDDDDEGDDVLGFRTNMHVMYPSSVCVYVYTRPFTEGFLPIYNFAFHLFFLLAWPPNIILGFNQEYILEL